MRKWNLPAMILAAALTGGWLDATAGASAVFGSNSAGAPEQSTHTQAAQALATEASNRPALPLDERLLPLGPAASEALLPVMAGTGHIRRSAAHASVELDAFVPALVEDLGRSAGVSVDVPGGPVTDAEREALVNLQASRLAEPDGEIPLPEPASIVLLVTGIATAVGGLWARRHMRLRGPGWLGLEAV